MQEVEVSKKSLLTALKINSIKHDKIYKAAVKGYWKERELKLKKALKDIKEDKKENKIENITIHLSAPVSYQEEYNKVIAMVEASVYKTIVLTANEFDSYFRNNWSWKNSFLTTNFMYASTEGLKGPNGPSGLAF